MTISTTTLRNSYSGNGSTTAFAYTYPINTTSEITVIERSATGTETVKTEGTGSTNYGIADNGAAGGTITMVTAPAAGTTLIILRNTQLTQETDYVANDPFPAETHEDALDKLQMQTQELQEELDRSIKISRTNTMTSTEFTVDAADRANKILAFDAAGEISVTQELGTFKGSDTTTTTAAYVQRDIIKSTTTAQLNNIYICVGDSVVGDTLTDTDHFQLLVDAVSAATSATAAASSATASANSATASASSATASANSATASASSATAGASSATSAASSATSAAASFDSFDDRYLGAKSSAPTTDNDGNALLTGALYFNSSSNQIFSWTGSAWVAIKPTSSEQTAINGAATNATNAANSATAAASSASTASTQASNASSSASTASTQASNASSSATAAASSATSAAASFDSFDDTYLGAKSSAPSVDNDGNSLATGALYFNSSAGNLNVWNGSAWVAIQADTDVKVSVSSNDTTPNFLLSKFTAGANISLTETNDGGNETITITNTGEDPTALAIALG